MAGMIAIGLSIGGNSPQALPRPASTVYVNPQCGNNQWSGATSACRSPDGPKRTLQAAINHAAAGDVVEMADGLYTGLGNQNLLIDKPLTLRSAGNDPQLCVIDGSDMTRGIRVINTGSNPDQTFIQGLTIQNCASDDSGGGVCLKSAATIKNCVIRNNRVPKEQGVGARGGGVYVGDSIQCVLIDLTIADNSASHNGGGIYCHSDSSAKLVNCHVIANSAGYAGGGLASLWSEVVMIGCRVAYNHAVGESVPPQGGGIASMSGSAMLVNCSIVENYTINAGGRGGGIAATGDSAVPGEITAINCLIVGNGAPAEDSANSQLGGGIFNQGAAASIINCTFALNFANQGAAYAEEYVDSPYTTSIDNSIFWQNGGSEASQLMLNDHNNAVMIRHCNIERGLEGISGSPALYQSNIADDPQFLDGDLRPRYSSPCRDAGASALLPLDQFDLDGDGDDSELVPLDATGIAARTVAAMCAVDIGAYEIQPQPLCQGDCAGGANDEPDGVVDIDDLVAVVNHFGDTISFADLSPGPCGDDVIDIDDLAVVISNWGVCE